MTKKREEQKELPGMPEPTPAVRHAQKYLEIKDKIDELNGDLAIQGKNLVEAMNQENRSKITIKGRTLTPRYIEATIKVSIKKEG